MKKMQNTRSQKKNLQPYGMILFLAIYTVILINS
uniref:Uncharacterized protein n=1 Tax=Rhizophora mucronata TaxID=61149 RepID=A0A2P2P6I0_RHIMU